ncbi:MAG: MOSC domain-containing protein [Actinomycetota bacterium]
MGAHPDAMPADATGSVVAVHRSGEHTFSKASQVSITLVAGLGVAGDAHQGARVKHRSRVERDPTQPNLRQVHLVASELLDEVGDAGFRVAPGDVGENITTSGLDLIRLPVGSTLRLGEDAIIALTGLRNPCIQIDAFQAGLQGAMLGRDEDGSLLRKTGVMSVVVRGGEVRPGDLIEVRFPPGPAVRMEKI